jgi:hypothetical protein
VAEVAELLDADDDDGDVDDSSLPQPARTNPTAKAAAVSGTTVRVRAEFMALFPIRPHPAGRLWPDITSESVNFLE